MNSPNWRSLAEKVALVMSVDEAGGERAFMEGADRVGLKVDAKFYAPYDPLQHRVAWSISADWTEEEESEFFAIYRALAYSDYYGGGAIIARPDAEFSDDIDAMTLAVDEIASSSFGVVAVSADYDEEVHAVLESVPAEIRSGISDWLLRSSLLILSSNAVSDMVRWCGGVVNDDEWAYPFYQSLNARHMWVPEFGDTVVKSGIRYVKRGGLQPTGGHG